MARSMPIKSSAYANFPRRRFGMPFRDGKSFRAADLTIQAEKLRAADRSFGTPARVAGVPKNLSGTF